MKWAALAPALLGCAPTDVVVATIPARHDGGAEHTCTTDDDCKVVDDYCQRDSCDDVTGHCAGRPKLCDATGPPVCGCDGISYWNDCIRMRQGITAVIPGERECLQSPRTCTGPGTCPHHASCARAFSSDKACAPGAIGVCWQLPAACPGPGEERYGRCGDPTSCEAACEAFRSEQPYQRLDLATCP
jgi:hypothetical protein